VIYDLLNRTISDDLEWPSRSFTYCKLIQMRFFVQLCKVSKVNVNLYSASS